MAGADLELRARPFEASSGNVITGYAAVFHAETVIAGEFRERIAPGAFARSLRENDVRALLHHDKGRVIGRMGNGTLRLSEDAHGLRFELDADPTTPDGQTAIGTIRRRDMEGVSFGFRVLAEDWTETGDLPLRTLKEIDLIEVSLVAWPAYKATTADMRSMTDGSGGMHAAARKRADRAERAMRQRGIR